MAIYEVYKPNLELYLINVTFINYCYIKVTICTSWDSALALDGFLFPVFSPFPLQINNKFRHFTF